MVSEYRIFRQLVDLGRTWDASRRIWTSGSDEDNEINSRLREDLERPRKASNQGLWALNVVSGDLS